MKWLSPFAPLAVLLLSCAYVPAGTPAKKVAFALRAPGTKDLDWTIREMVLRASEPPPPPPPEPTAASLRPGWAFDERTWMLLRSEQTGLVESALPGPDAGYVAVRGDFVSYARRLLLSRPDLFGIRDPSQLVLDGTPDVADDGTTDVTFRQYVAGGRVLETGITVRIAKNRTLRAVNGSLRAIRRVLPATITAEQALVLARAVKTSTCGKFRPISAELVAEQEGSTTYILNYNVDGVTAAGAGAARVNARTGEAHFAGSTDFDMLGTIGEPTLPCP